MNPWTSEKATWHEVIAAAKQELYPKIASQLEEYVTELLEKESIRLNAFDDDAVSAVIRVLKQKKSNLLNKEIWYIKGLVERALQCREHPNSNTIDKNHSSFR